MSKVASVTTYILRKLWTLFAIVLVLFALLMSLLRYSLPYLDDHKHRVETYISDKYAVNLSIQELSASWNSSGPALVLRGVNLAKGKQSPIDLTVGELFLELDFWPSVSSLTLQSKQVALNKLNIDIEISQIEAGESEFPIVQALETIFLEQLSSFAVSNSRITLNSVQNSKSFDIARLSWLNLDNRHQGTGSFALEGVAENQATFILDLYGDVESYSGTLYAQATDVDLSAWINEFTNLDGKLASSKGNVEAWAHINNGAIKRVDGQIKPSILTWESENFGLKNEIIAKFAAFRRERQWDFSVDDIEFKTDESSLQASFDGSYDTRNGLVLNMRNEVSLRSILPMAGLFSLELADRLALLNADLNLQSLALLASNDQLALKAQISDIKWQAYGDYVGMDALNIDVLWLDTVGKVIVNGQDVSVFTEHYLDRDLKIKSTEIPIYINVSETTFVDVQNASFEIDDLTLTANAQYSDVDNFLSLLVNIDPLALTQVPLWLPNHLMSKDAKKYLTNAFVGEGEIKQASVLWHGSLSKQSPQQKDINRIFQSSLHIEQADFLFSNTWPMLQELDINLLFENAGLYMTSPASKLGEVQLSNLSATIPSLAKNALLTINSKGDASASDVTALMLDSSLANSLGRVLDKNVLVSGELQTDLKLLIPLSDAQNTRAIGTVYFDGNGINIPAVNLSFNNAIGQLSFDNENISITDLTANLFGQTVQTSLLGSQGKQSYNLDLDLLGNWDIKALAANISDDFSAFLSGQTNWSLDFQAQIAKDDFRYQASLNSNLLGVNSNLPMPFTKLADNGRALNIAANGDNLASSIDINIDEVARFDGAFAHKEKQFNRAHLAIGPTELESRGVGFSISGNLEHMIFSEWQSVVAAIQAGISQGQNGFLKAPRRIFIDTEKLSVLGETFTDVDITAKRLENQWTLDIDSNQMRSAVAIHDEWYSKGVQVEAEYIHLAKADELAEPSKSLPKTTIDPKTLPSINVSCKSCKLYGYDLGRLQIEAEPNDDGLKINQILVNNEHGNISAAGQWYKRNKDHFTFIAGDLFSGDFGGFLEQMGFDSGIQDSQANMSFALTWKDSPFDITAENLDGELDWRLTDGYLTEVSDKGSRIFTLLSLNSLVRKLSLDFRDVFAKGFFYDNMQGSVQITQGKADTRDTNIDGAAGEIEIYGYTDLASQELNYNVSFAPNVTGNLPVLVYFFTVSPPSALAALAIDQVLTSTKVISNVNYSVTGTIKEPILIETGRESTEVELPARREAIPKEDPEFIVPTQDDLLKIEVQDGQSD